MENTLSLVKSETLSENMDLIGSFIKQSYNFASKHVQDGVHFIKEEISGLYDITTSCLGRMALPVNNFLKDIAQIDAEFKTELNIMPDPAAIPGMVNLHEAISSGCMEENY